ncbi:protein NPGR2 isoform X1 [Amborella trichopoda]|nr:protein NPGR2 isoform X1 [Amborella trichopoda]|eukprot:XP_006857444.2 protein NPGR2 isoform X1 [Amborella trichopoda]
MRNKRKWMREKYIEIRLRVRKIMQCLCSGEQLIGDEMPQSPESLATRDYSASGYSSRVEEGEPRVDRGNIEEAESSLREGICLNYEEARALLGRLEYQRGNIEAALHVFEGIDVGAIVPKMKLSIARRVERSRRRSRSDVTPPPMSMHAVSLLLEAIFLKAKSLQDLKRFKEAAESCKVVLDTVESALPEGMPENFGADCKLQETLSKALELLPELWKQLGLYQEAISSYRRALINHWNLEPEPLANIQKEFAIFLLYGGTDASPPNLRSQMEASFIPKNNLEEAILLLLILLRKFSLNRIKWDPSIIDHLTFALSMSGGFLSLANQIEEFLPGVLQREDRWYTLSLCYLAEGLDGVSLNLLKKLLSSRERPDCVRALLLASKICGEDKNLAQEGTYYAQRVLTSLKRKSVECQILESVANCLMGVSLSTQSRHAESDSERVTKQSEALQAFEAAEKFTGDNDIEIIYRISLENAEQRRLEVALDYAKGLLKMEGGSSIRGWILLARVLSAQKRFSDAEMVLDAALEQTGKWDHGRLLKTKAKVQVAKSQYKNAIETYTRLLAVLQVRSKCFGVGKRLLKGEDDDRSLEMETWHDLAHVYMSMSQWRDAEVCLLKSKAINPCSASRWHATGALYEAKGQNAEALKAFSNALEIEPTHAPSLVSMAAILRQSGGRSLAAARSFLSEALKHDTTDFSAWFNLGLVYKEDKGSLNEALECFQAAVLLQETAPVESFRSK